MPRFIDRRAREGIDLNRELLQVFRELSDHDRRVARYVKDHIFEVLQQLVVRDVIEGRVLKNIVSLVDPGFKFADWSEGSSPIEGDGEGSGKSGKGKDKAGDISGGAVKAGKQPAPLSYPKDIPPELIFDEIFELVELPVVIRKRLRGKRKRVRFLGSKRSGPSSRLDRSRTFEQKLSRERRVGKKNLPFQLTDRRYRAVKLREDRGIRGTVYLVRDRSGSMSDEKIALLKTLLILVCAFLLTRYKELKLIYIVHDTEAHTVDESGFWYEPSKGGTRLSSGSAKVEELVRDGPKSDVYVLQFSDGENEESDNTTLKQSIRRLLEVALFYAYCEVQPGATPNVSTDSMRLRGTIFNELRDLLKRYHSFHMARITKFSETRDVFLALFDKVETQHTHARRRKRHA